MDFEKNCVFLDEAGFNPHISRTRSWSKKWKPAKVVVPAFKGTSVTISGAISGAGVNDISLRKSISVTTSTKKRRADERLCRQLQGLELKLSITLLILNVIMVVLDKNDMKEYYLVMDNAPIHKPAIVRKMIENRGYKCAYLPPYSPFLNPIELFWSKVR